MIPGAEGLAIAFRIVAASLLAQPPLLQKFGMQLCDRGVLVDLNVAEKTKPLADGTSRAEFASGEGHGACGFSACGETRLPQEYISELRLGGAGRANPSGATVQLRDQRRQ
jgi:hypothetical protein